MKKYVTVIVVIFVFVLTLYLSKNKLMKLIYNDPVIKGADFKWFEMVKTDQLIPNIPNSKEKARIRELVINVLQPIRNMFNKEVILNSVFRSHDVNKAVGGVATSQHRLGEAADIGSIKGYDLFEAFNIIKSSGIPYDQLIYETGKKNNPDAEWIHVSYSTSKKPRRMAMYAPYDYQLKKRVYKRA